MKPTAATLWNVGGAYPEYHIRADARELTKLHWDMVIAHPPCTYLAASGAVRLYGKNGEIKDVERYIKGYEASRFFQFFLDLDCEKVAVENPVMLKEYGIRKYDQIIEPYMFGDPWRKKTCLWLKGLPPLVPTNIVKPRGLLVESTSKKWDRTTMSEYDLKGTKNQKMRSRTFRGVARAMAEQWAGDNR